MFKIFEEATEMLRKTLKDSSDDQKLVDVTFYFSELLELKQPRNLTIKLHNLDFKLNHGDIFKSAVILSSKCDKSKLSFKIKSVEDSLELYVAYNGDNANGHFVIESKELDKVSVQNDNGDITISKIPVSILNAKNDNGDSIVESVQSQNINITSLNGDIVLTLSYASKLILDVRNGDIIRNGVKSSDNSTSVIKCVNKNGDIILKKE